MLHGANGDVHSVVSAASVWWVMKAGINARCIRKVTVSKFTLRYSSSFLCFKF